MFRRPFRVVTILDSDSYVPVAIFIISYNVSLYQDALTDLTGQQEELNIEGVEACYAHKVHRMFLLLDAKCGGSEVYLRRVGCFNGFLSIKMFSLNK